VSTPIGTALWPHKQVSHRNPTKSNHTCWTYNPCFTYRSYANNLFSTYTIRI